MPGDKFQRMLDQIEKAYPSEDYPGVDEALEDLKMAMAGEAEEEEDMETEEEPEMPMEMDFSEEEDEELY